MEFLKLILAIIVISPFLEKTTDPNMVYIGVTILLCGFVAHGNGK